MTCLIWTDNDVELTSNKKGDKGSLRTCMSVMSTTNVVCHTQPRVLGHLLFYSIVGSTVRETPPFHFLIGLLFLCLYD
jgi:hypothetical protein